LLVVGGALIYFAYKLITKPPVPPEVGAEVGVRVD